MLKEKIWNIILILFFGVMIIYINHKPPKCIVKHPNMNKITETSQQ